MSKLTDQQISDAIYYTLVDHPNVAYSLDQIFSLITRPNDMNFLKNARDWSRDDYEKFTNVFCSLAENQKDISKKYNWGNFEPVLVFQTKNEYSQCTLHLTRSEPREFINQKALDSLREILSNRHSYKWFSVTQYVTDIDFALTFTIKMNKPEMFSVLISNASYEDLTTKNLDGYDVFACVEQSDNPLFTKILLTKMTELYKKLHTQVQPSRYDTFVKGTKDIFTKGLYFVGGAVTFKIYSFF